VRFAELAHGDGHRGGDAFEALIERQMKNSDTALGRQDSGPARQGRRQVTTYDLGMLHVESRFEMPRIVEALKRARPRHAVLPRRARHRQDGAGEYIAAGGWASP
jgi:hypothetical protein